MNWSHFAGFMLLGTTLSLAAGCSDAAQAPGSDPAQVGEIKGGSLSDDQLKAKLAKLAEGTNFMSETDETYHLIEGDGAKVSVITSTVVRKRLSVAIKAALKNQLGGEQDLSKIRAEKEDFKQWMQDAREGANDATQDKETRDNDRKVADALQFMQDHLRGVTAFAFGRDENGDGSVVFVFVGRSKTTGRLIGLTTFGAFT